MPLHADEPVGAVAFDGLDGAVDADGDRSQAAAEAVDALMVIATDGQLVHAHQLGQFGARLQGQGRQDVPVRAVHVRGDGAARLNRNQDAGPGHSAIQVVLSSVYLPSACTELLARVAASSTVSNSRPGHPGGGVQLEGGPSSTHMMLPSLSLNQAAFPIPGRVATEPFHSTPGMPS